MKMDQLTKKESTYAAAVGVLIGSIAGVMISLSMFKEHKKCEMLKRENRMLQEMVMNYQEREYVAH